MRALGGLGADAGVSNSLQTPAKAVAGAVAAPSTLRKHAAAALPAPAPALAICDVAPRPAAVITTAQGLFEYAQQLWNEVCCAAGQASIMLH